MSNKKKSPSPTVIGPTAVPTVVIEPAALDLKTAAVFLSTTLRQVRSLCCARELTPILLGKKQVILTSDLREFIQKQRRVA